MWFNPTEMVLIFVGKLSTFTMGNRHWMNLFVLLFWWNWFQWYYRVIPCFVPFWYKIRESLSPSFYHSILSLWTSGCAFPHRLRLSCESIPIWPAIDKCLVFGFHLSIHHYCYVVYNYLVLIWSRGRLCELCSPRCSLNHYRLQHQTWRILPPICRNIVNSLSSS